MTNNYWPVLILSCMILGIILCYKKLHDNSKFMFCVSFISLMIIDLCLLELVNLHASWLKHYYFVMLCYEIRKLELI